jgi:hypothetical protein
VSFIDVNREPWAGSDLSGNKKFFCKAQLTARMLLLCRGEGCYEPRLDDLG